MKSKRINIILILIGSFVAIYAQAGESQNVYVLVIGLFVLMLGLYRLSRGIPSKHNEEDNDDGNQEN